MWLLLSACVACRRSRVGCASGPGKRSEEQSVLHGELPLQLLELRLCCLWDIKKQSRAVKLGMQDDLQVGTASKLTASSTLSLP